MQTPIKNGKLQTDLDANQFTILNLNPSGLNLTRDLVGLGNVDNTSDLNKPLSTATVAALLLKEPIISAGTNQQFWRGDKTFVNYGELALQNAEMTLDHFGVKATGASTSSYIRAKRNDYPTALVYTMLQQFGASVSGNILASVAAANAGVVQFTGTSNAVIFTNNAVPLIFGTNNIERARILLGLNVGGVFDPGIGSIACSGTIAAGGNIASSAAIFGASATFTGDLSVGSNATVAGDLSVTGAISTAFNLAVVGNTAVTGFLNVGNYIKGAFYDATDAAAANNNIYYSTDQNKLRYRDKAGTAHDLY